MIRIYVAVLLLCASLVQGLLKNPFKPVSSVALSRAAFNASKQHANHVLFTTASNTDAESKSQLTILDLALCGALATAFGDFVMHPLDTIKITQQTAAIPKSLLSTASDIVASKGLGGLYGGVVPYVLGDGMAGAVKFSVYEVVKKYVEDRVDEKYHKFTKFFCAVKVDIFEDARIGESISLLCLSDVTSAEISTFLVNGGSLAMLASSFVLVPAEVVKTRLQAGSGSSIIGTVLAILGKEGAKGLYAGYFATLVRDLPYTILELGLYENIKALIQRRPPHPPLLRAPYDELSAAAITGGMVSLVTTPLDLVKTLMMMGTHDGGVFATLSSIYQARGWAGVFTGWGARVGWLLPFTTIYLYVYEVLKRMAGRYREAKSRQ
eukprot:gene24732-29884_t